MLKSPLLLVSTLLLLLLSAQANAQTVVTILSSDRTQQVSDPTDGLIRKLTGDVWLRTPDVEIRADSAWHYVDKGEVHGFGNLRVDTNKETIWADRIVYDVNAEISSLSGNVIIETASALIYSQTALYSFLTEIALFNDPIWLEDEDGVMRADDGVYFSQQDSAIFRGNVQLTDLTQYIEADSMFTNRRSESYALYGNVFLRDDENRTRILGEFVEADSTGRRLIEGDAVLWRLNEALTDTTWLQADRILVTRVDTFNIIDATGSVELWEDRYASRADSSRYNEQTEQLWLRKSPVVWYKETELNGEAIDIQLKNDSLETVIAFDDPFAAQLDTLSGRINQMRGDTLALYFAENNIVLIDLIENAELLVHIRDDDEEPDGAVQTTARRIRIYFSNGEAENMRVFEGIDGTFLDESPDLGNQQISGYRWNPELRPTRPDFDMEARKPPMDLHPPFQRQGVEIERKSILTEADN